MTVLHGSTCGHFWSGLVLNQILSHGSNFYTLIWPLFELIPICSNRLTCIMKPARGVLLAPCFSTRLSNLSPLPLVSVRTLLVCSTRSHCVLTTFCFFVSNPDTSLCSALSLLNSFSQLSGFNINFEKSDFFQLVVVQKLWVLPIFYLKIEYHKLSYLGVSVTQKHKDLFKENFLNLSKKIT